MFVTGYNDAILPTRNIVLKNKSDNNIDNEGEQKQGGS